MLIIDPDRQSLRLLVRADDRYEEVERSTLLDVAKAELERQIRWR